YAEPFRPLPTPCATAVNRQMAMGNNSEPLSLQSVPGLGSQQGQTLASLSAYPRQACRCSCRRPLACLSPCPLAYCTVVGRRSPANFLAPARWSIPASERTGRIPRLPSLPRLRSPAMDLPLPPSIRYDQAARYLLQRARALLFYWLLGLGQKMFQEPISRV